MKLNVLFWNSCVSKDLKYGFLMFWNANMVLVYLDFKCFSSDWRFGRCAISSEFTGNARSLGFGILVFYC